MVKLNQEDFSVEFDGTAAQVATEFSVGLRKLRDQLIDPIGEEEANKLIDAICERAKMTSQELIKDALLHGDELTKALALNLCGEMANSESSMLEYLENLVKELKEKKAESK